MLQNQDMFYFYKAKVNKVVDGDTVDITIDLGFGLFKEVKARLWGLNAPEIFHPKDEEELMRGFQAKAYIEQWLKNNAPNGDIFIRSHNGKELRQEKYGRWLIEIYATSAKDAVALNDMLVKEHLAVEYMRKG